MDGYIKEYIDVIRYIDDDMVLIENVEVLVSRSSEDDYEIIDMIIPESSQEYIKLELEKIKNTSLISKYCVKEDVKAYS